MGARQKEWARRKRAELVARLGGKCAVCGSEFDLEIDHPAGRDWSMRRTEFSARISRLCREADEGLLRLLCQYHNARIRPRQNQYPPKAALALQQKGVGVEEPF